MDPVRVVGKGKQESVSKRKFLFGFYGWRYDLYLKTVYGQNTTFEWVCGDLSALYFIFFIHIIFFKFYESPFKLSIIKSHFKVFFF